MLAEQEWGPGDELWNPHKKPGTKGDTLCNISTGDGGRGRDEQNSKLTSLTVLSTG